MLLRGYELHDAAAASVAVLFCLAKRSSEHRRHPGCPDSLENHRSTSRGLFRVPTSDREIAVSTPLRLRVSAIQRRRLSSGEGGDDPAGRRPRSTEAATPRLSSTLS